MITTLFTDTEAIDEFSIPYSVGSQFASCVPPFFDIPILKILNGVNWYTRLGALTMFVPQFAWLFHFITNKPEMFSCKVKCQVLQETMIGISDKSSMHKMKLQMLVYPLYTKGGGIYLPLKWVYFTRLLVKLILYNKTL